MSPHSRLRAPTPLDRNTPDRRRRPPPARTSFIGRDEDVAALVALLRSPAAGVVTITGRSGAGKTRLASEVARRIDGEFPGGAVFVDCSSIQDRGFIPGALADALALQVAQGQPPEDALRRSLRYTPSLVLADDLDHVPGGAEVVLDILDGCPASRLLVTATAPLRVPGEHVLRLGPLGLPQALASGHGHQPAVESLLDSPAVALFCDRASAVDVRFRCTPENVGTVVELCRRLDGLPLALELAAARVPALPPEAQLAAFARVTPLDLAPLRATERTGRHRELRAAIEWSHRLLGATEQVLLRRMGEFDGPASLDAIRAICADADWDEPRLLDALTVLVDVHLLEPDFASGGPRYRLLPTVAEFARERLEAAGEVDLVAERHVTWFLALARPAVGLAGDAQAGTLVEYRNDLRRALGRLVTTGDVARALELAADLGPLWHQQGLFGQARRWFDDLLAAVPEDNAPVEVRARALLWGAILAGDQPSGPDVGLVTRERLNAGLALARETGSDPLLVLALWASVRTVFVTRDLAGAAAAAAEGLAAARRIGDSGWESRFLSLVGMAAQQAGDLPTAARLGTEALDAALRTTDRSALIPAGLLLHSIPPEVAPLPAAMPSLEALLALSRSLGDTVSESHFLARLAWRAARRGDLRQAAAWCADGLRAGQRTGAWHGGAFVIVSLALVAEQRHDDEVVARLHGSIERLMPAIQFGLTAASHEVYRDAVETARARCGPGEFDAAVAQGRMLDWDAALAAALDYASCLTASTVPEPVAGVAPGRRGRRSFNGIEQLTPREIDVLRVLARGDTNKQIAAALGLTPKTVMHHSVSIYAKLGVRGRAEATAWAYRNGVLDEVAAG